MIGAVIARDAEERGQGICRTCCEPIWNEGGTVGGDKRDEGWSDRIERGGDSLVCFKAVDYRHVPLDGREAAIYDRAHSHGVASVPAPVETAPAQTSTCHHCGAVTTIRVVHSDGTQVDLGNPDQAGIVECALCDRQLVEFTTCRV